MPPQKRPVGPIDEAYRAQRHAKDAAAAAEIAKDSRFTAALNDPRFSKGLSRKQRTVAVDERFAGMFTHGDFQTKASVDKRGFKVAGGKKAKGDDLKRYYRLKDEGFEAPGQPADDKSAQPQAEAAAAGGAPAPPKKQAGQEQKPGSKQAKKQSSAAAAAAPGAGQQATKAVAKKASTAVGVSPVDGTRAAQAGTSKEAKNRVQGATTLDARKPSKQKSVKAGVAGSPVPSKHAAKAAPAKAASAKAAPASILPDEDMLEGESSEEGEEMSDVSGDDGSDADEESSGEEEEEEEDEEVARRRRWERARGIAPGGGSDSDSEDEGENDDDDDGASSSSSYDSADDPFSDEEEDEEVVLQRAVAEWGVGAMAANPAERIPTGDETHRLAVVDQDWQHMRAVDLLAGFNSFLPKGSRILRVTVYPSDYGLKRMAEENTLGPQGILKPVVSAKPLKAGRTNGHDSDDEGTGSDDTEGQEDAGDAAGDDRGEEDEERELDLARLRMYETSKLRYYYAVVECDSVATATALYNECDGLEFEHSACKLDLRFIPDEESFEGRQVRDSATSVPPGYTPPEAYTTSLQHTDPTLTWDGEDVRRKRILQKKMTEDEIKEADFAAFMASSSDEEEEPEEQRGPGTPPLPNGGTKAEGAAALRERYRALLLGGGGEPSGQGGRNGRNGQEQETDEEAETSGRENDEAAAQRRPKGDGRRGDFEMEVTYVPGLEGLGKKLIAAKRDAEAKKSESVWEAYLRRRKEKKKERKNKRAESSSSEGDEDAEDINRNNDESFFAKADDASEDPFADNFFNDPSQGVAEDSEEEAMAGASDGRKPAGKDAKSDSKGKAGKKGTKGEAGKGAGKGAAEAKGDAAELELLLMDDDDIRLAALKGAPGATAALARHARQSKDAEPDSSGQRQKHQVSEGAPDGGTVPLRGKKAKRAAKRDKAREVAATFKDDEEVAEFAADLQDPRFEGLLADHEFALDPTDPRFEAMKGTSVAQQLRTLKKAYGKTTAASAPRPGKQQQGQQNPPPGQDQQQQREANDLRGMVAKLKRRGQQQQEEQNQKTKRLHM